MYEDFGKVGAVFLRLLMMRSDRKRFLDYIDGILRENDLPSLIGESGDYLPVDDYVVALFDSISDIIADALDSAVGHYDDDDDDEDGWDDDWDDEDEEEPQRVSNEGQDRILSMIKELREKHNGGGGVVS